MLARGFVAPVLDAHPADLSVLSAPICVLAHGPPAPVGLTQASGACQLVTGIKLAQRSRAAMRHTQPTALRELAAAVMRTHRPPPHLTVMRTAHHHCISAPRPRLSAHRPFGASSDMCSNRTTTPS